MVWLFLRVRKSLGRGRCPATCSLVAVETYGHVNVVSVTGWLAEPFRRCRFSAAAVFLPSSKLSAAVLIVPLHSSLSSASASHSLWSMPACVSCRFNWSLKTNHIIVIIIIIIIIIIIMTILTIIFIIKYKSKQKEEKIKMSDLQTSITMILISIIL